jgi:SAM-dependent methyltransferase
MKATNPAKTEYGNWVSNKLIAGPGVIGLVFLALAFLSPFWLIGATPFLLIAAYFAYARLRFSPQGGDVQGRIRALVLEQLDWDGNGQALDIGCGNGALAIELARKYPGVRVTGIDYWGGSWEYSQGVCEANAVSNLVFHEVRDAADKRKVLQEALRVVRKGGKFAFQDLFYLKPIYGEIDDLLATIEGWGISKVEFVETRRAPFIPRLLKLPFMVGTLGLIVGEK